MKSTIICPIYQWSQKTPANPAIITATTIYSYDMLDRLVTAVKKVLVARGITVGQRIGLTGENSVSFILVLVALWRIGAVAVPVNYRLPPSVFATLSKKLGLSSFLVWKEIFPVVPSLHSVSFPLIHLNRHATIILTSGSTGEEKGVLHSYGNLYYNALGSNRNIRLRSGDSWLLALPLFHVGGLGILFRTFLAGTSVVIPETGEPLEISIPRYHITHVSLVSTQLYRLLECNAAKHFSTLKAMLLGGSAFPESLIRAAVDHKLPLFTSYGLSEMASQVTTTPVGANWAQLLTSGLRLPHRRIKISPLGEILVAGPVRFRGYVEGSALVLPFDSQGWFATGDLGQFDDEGYLHVLGRRDSMFISGGENIMPEEIEFVLAQVPGVEQAVVVPVEDLEYGFRPVAFVKAIGKPVLVREEVLASLAQRLPRFKVPDRFYQWPVGVGEGMLKIKRPFFKQLATRPGELTLLFQK